MAFQFGPGGAAVLGAIKAAARTAAGEGPGLAAHLPQGRIDDFRVGGVVGDVNGAGVLVLVEHLGPTLSAIRRAEHAALRIGAKGVTDGGDHDDVGIGWINNYRADLAAILQADMGPGLAPVSGLVDAVAKGDVAAQSALACADIDNVRV